MSKRFKHSLVFSLISSILSAVFWYIIYSFRDVEALLEGALLFGGMSFVLILLYSYMITYRRL